jgi:hypothetical protein
MFDRIANGWELTKQSFKVLRLDKELLLFPLVSGISCLAVLASFVLPLWNSPYAQVVLNEHQVPKDPVAWVILFAFYFVNYFVIVYFNSALVACAIIRFKGGDPTVADGFRAATARMPQILAWALVSATVGIILKVIESRSERVGQIVSGLLGAAFSIAAYFVVPVLVVEKAGPFEAIQRSLSVLKRTWGEALTANFGIGFIVFLLTLVGIVPLIGGVALCVSGQLALGIALLVLGGAVLMLVALVSSALDAIILAALYLYAAEGTVPKYFDRGLLEGAFGKE